MSTATATTPAKIHFLAYVPSEPDRAVFELSDLHEGITYAKSVLGPSAQVYTYPTPQDFFNPLQHRRIA